MTLTTSRIPAGWYPDPLGHPQQRWWDGRAWDQRTSDEAGGPGSAPFVSAKDLAAAAPPSEEEPVVASRGMDWALAPAAPTAPATPAAPAAPAAPATSAAPAARAVPSAPSAPAMEPPAEPTARTGEHPLGAFTAGSGAGWEQLATLILASRDFPGDAASNLIQVVMADGSRLVIDARHSFAWWPSPLADLPPTSDGAATTMVERADPTATEGPAQDAEPLLWRIGVGLDVTGAAHPVSATAAHRLRRWPNLTAIEHTAEQASMIAMLAHAALTADQLAQIARTEPHEARRLLSALAVAGLLTTEDTPARASAPAAPPTPRGTGLFSRLRARFGR